MNTFPLSEYRCTCGRLLFKGAMLISRIDIKCKRCSAIIPFGSDATDDGASHYGIILDGTSHIREVSETACEILGYSRAELIAMDSHQLSPYWSGNSDQGTWQSKGASVVLDMHHTTKTGTLLSVRMRARPLQALREKLTLCMFETLIDERTSTLHDAPVEEGIVVHSFVAQVDFDCKCVYISHALASFLEKDPIHVVGSTFFESIRLKDQDEKAYKRIFSKMLPSRSSYSIQNASLTDEQGNERLFTLHHTPSYGDDGCLAGYTVVFEG